jgi:hypothetical protein
MTENPNQVRNRAIQAANNMRDEIGNKYQAALRSVVFWVILLMGASLIFAALTSRPLMRFTGEYTTAYLIGVFLHAALGLSMHMWKLGLMRRERIYHIFGLFVLLLVAGILVIAYFRAQLAIERGQPEIGAYLVSLFMAILEIVVPTMFGAMLANAWRRYETLKPDYEWARELAHRMLTENDPMEAWIHEAFALQNKKRDLIGQIQQWETALHEADAQRNWNEVKTLQERMARAKEEIQVLGNRIEEVEKWYPGGPNELRRMVDGMLGQA